MAANLRNSALASFGKRFVSQIHSPDFINILPSLSIRRSVHVSVYDKNPEENVRPAVVPDDVISPHAGNFWEPHPQTGVFGPAKDHTPSSGVERDIHASASVGVGSVLEQKVFFRPLEVLDKPVQH